MIVYNFFLNIYRAICDHMFKELGEKEKIYKFSSPKILRLIEAVQQFKPKPQVTEPKIADDECKTVQNGEIEAPSDLSVNHVNSDLSCSLMNDSTSVNNINNQNHQAIIEIDQREISDASTEDVSNNPDDQIRNSVIKQLVDDMHESIDEDNKCNVINKPAQLNCNGVPINSCSNQDTTHNAKENPIISDNSESGSTISFNHNGMNGEKLKIEDGEGIGRGGRWRGRGRGWRFQKKQLAISRTNNKSGSQDDLENLCGIIFVENSFTAKILFHLFNVSILIIFSKTFDLHFMY